MKLYLTLGLIILLPIFVFAKGKIDVPFEEIGRWPGLNAMNVFIYTQPKDRASLEKIVKLYKKRYSSFNVLFIQFFNDQKKTAHIMDHRNDITDDEWKCEIGSYSRNKNTGLDRLLDTFGGDPNTQLAK
jgi:hypothetical protein